MIQPSGVRIRTEGAVGYLELDRPGRANAYTEPMLGQLAEALDRFAADEQVRAIVVGSTTAGKFCGGADLQEIRRRGPADALELRSARLFDDLAACPVPTIAAIGGPAVGGGLELALACDLRIATPDAHFAFPETGFGIIPAAGGTFRLPRIVGPAMARQMILFGHRMDAEQALQWGLVNEIVEPGGLTPRVEYWAAAAAERDPLALRLAKQAMEMSQPDGGGKAFSTCAQALLYPGGRNERPDDE